MNTNKLSTTSCISRKIYYQFANHSPNHPAYAECRSASNKSMLPLDMKLMSIAADTPSTTALILLTLLMPRTEKKLLREKSEAKDMDAPREKSDTKEQTARTESHE